jgi:hypothetical protein
MRLCIYVYSMAPMYTILQYISCVANHLHLTHTADHAVHGHDVRLPSDSWCRHVFLLRGAAHRACLVFQA